MLSKMKKTILFALLGTLAINTAHAGWFFKKPEPKVLISSGS